MAYCQQTIAVGPAPHKAVAGGTCAKSHCLKVISTCLLGPKSGLQSVGVIGQSSTAHYHGVLGLLESTKYPDSPN